MPFPFVAPFRDALAGLLLGFLLGCHGAQAGNGAGNGSLSAAGDPAMIQALDRLSALARQRGTVRIIVRVKIAFVPEGDLDERAARAQRDAIAAAQSAVLAAVPAQAPDRVRRFESIPFLGMEVDAEELQRLIRLPEVADIEEDRLAQPAPSAALPSAPDKPGVPSTE